MMMKIILKTAFVMMLCGPAMAAPPQKLLLAGGCFWGVEAVFEHVKGVTGAVSGYAGGKAETAHYDMIGSGKTGHAEVVEITYDPDIVSQEDLLNVFFTVAHDPTELNRQGPDIGPHYRSAIFYDSLAQKQAAEAYIEKLEKIGTYKKPIVTTLESLEAFYPAEGYHQNFLKNNPRHPYIVRHDLPKLAALKKEFPELYQK